jgi:hypothetical protein
VLVTQSLAPIAFPLFSRLPANLAGMEGLLPCGKDTLSNGVIRVVHIKAQPAERLLHLQNLKLLSGLPLEFDDQWLQVSA